MYVSNSTDSNTRVRVLKKDGHAGVFLCVYEPRPSLERVFRLSIGMLELESSCPPELELEVAPPEMDLEY